MPLAMILYIYMFNPILYSTDYHNMWCNIYILQKALDMGDFMVYLSEIATSASLVVSPPLQLLSVSTFIGQHLQHLGEYVQLGTETVKCMWKVWLWEKKCVLRNYEYSLFHLWYNDGILHVSMIWPSVGQHPWLEVFQKY